VTASGQEVRRYFRFGISKGILMILLAAVVWIVRAAALQSLPAAAAEDPAQIYKNVYSGWKWWHVYCYRCHGMNAVGGSLAPDLLDPNRKMTLSEFLPKVRGGSPDKGMQGFEKLLDDKQIAQVYAYVRARADKVLPPGRPDELGPGHGPWVPPEGWPKQK